MRFTVLSLLAVCASPLASAKWTNDSPEPIERAPAPWTLKGDIYGMTFIPPSADLPTKAFSPLERNSKVATEGTYVAGIGMIQLIRYHESPVGPYDELLIVPGFYKYDAPEGERKNVRITRIYVSQKYTAWNGRTNWNIPKHLARFDWDEQENGDTTVKVYPYDTTGDETESKPATKPWFQATFKPDLPIGLPFSAGLFDLFGANTTLAQPPLPHKDSHYKELAGTDRWAATVPGQETLFAQLGVVDLYQGDGDRVDGKDVNAVGDEVFPNFWPGLLPVHPAMKLTDATITFSDPEIWDA